MRDPGPCEFEDGQARTLEKRARLTHEHLLDVSRRSELADHCEGGPSSGGGQRAGVAVRQDPSRAGEGFRPVSSNCCAGRLLLGLDCHGLGECRGALVSGPRAQCGRSHAVDSASQVCRRRPRLAQKRACTVQRVATALRAQ